MKSAVIEKILEEKIVVIVRGVEREKLIPLARAMYDGGIRLLEITYSADGSVSDENTADNIHMLAKHFENKMYIGAGTVLTEKQVELTKNAGGQFIISPDTCESVIKKTCALNMVSMPGALTPSEIQAAHIGGNRNTIDDTEELRDELVSIAAGTWDYIKNSGHFNSEKWDLDFLGFLPGKRESRRMCGEYMITQRDISDGRVFEDEIAFGGWPLDDHFPGGFYHRGVPNTDYQTPAPYSLPYRALYSKNVENLFFAGRNISMTHMAMSSIRVMATCALLGEAVGKAASIAVRNSFTPHDVYCNKIDLLQSLLMNEDCFLPSKTREISSLCMEAKLNVDGDIIRNGQDRAHRIYNTDENNCSYIAEKNEEICYSFNKTDVSTVHIVFCSDLNRDTLPGSHCERVHSTRANQRLDSPQMHMPKTLCREFRLLGELNGERCELLYVSDNRKRSYHLNINRELDKLILIPEDSWGDDERIPVISFDFD